MTRPNTAITPPGRRSIDAENAREAMKGLLAEIQNGNWAAAWIAENEAGRDEASRLRDEHANSQIEEVGKGSARDDALPGSRGIVRSQTETEQTFMPSAESDVRKRIWIFDTTLRRRAIAWRNHDRRRKARDVGRPGRAGRRHHRSRLPGPPRLATSKRSLIAERVKGATVAGLARAN